MRNDDMLIGQWAKMCENLTTDGTFKVETLEDQESIRPFIDEMIKLLVDAYHGKFLIAKRPKDLLKNTDLAKIARDSNGRIIACALYRTDLDGKKMMCVGGLVGNTLKREAVKEIIRSDIEPYDGWYWAEVSGKIEDYFKQLNGNPIPNALAPVFLGLDTIELEEDGVHYIREIGKDKVPYSKMIFGFRNESDVKLRRFQARNQPS